MKYWMLVLIPVVALSIGCAPTIMGTPIDRAKLDQIVPGTTTDAKVMEVFGQPFKKEMVAGKVELFSRCIRRMRGEEDPPRRDPPVVVVVQIHIAAAIGCLSVGFIYWQDGGQIR